jgi:probable HAF family extracellular repeat protein
MKMRLVVGSVAALGLFLATAGTAPGDYIVTDLGTPFGFGGSTAYGINDAGQIVGNAYGKGWDSGFVYSNGSMTAVGSPGAYRSVATAINSSGQVVGYNVSSTSLRSAFLYSNSVLIPLTDGSESAAFAINSAGNVVGLMHNHAFLYDGHGYTDLGTFGGIYSVASGINNRGQVVGYNFANGLGHASLYSYGKTTDLGSLQGHFGSSWALAINNVGQVVGWSSAPWGMHAFLYSGGKMSDLGTLGGDESQARAINDAGQVVGYSNLSKGSSQYHAFLYQNGKMIDLNSLIPPETHFTLLQAFGINNQGQIVGTGVGPDGSQQAFVLTPTDAPEPSSLMLLGIGGLGLAGYASRRKRAAAAVTGSAPCTAAAPTPGRAS